MLSRSTTADMMHVAFLLLIIFTAIQPQFLKKDGVASEKVCSYQDILDHLNLTTDNSVFRLTRPVVDHTQLTRVELDIYLYAILAVVEKTQTFIPFIWATVRWNNDRISWDPNQFCGITKISIPRDILWRPDLFIYEMVQKDDSPVNPYMQVSYDGMVLSEEDIKIVTTCKMDVHKFPFDTQSCTISIGSTMFCADEFRLLPYSNSSRATQFSREVLRTQGEWEFLQLSVESFNFSFQDRMWEQLIYTVTMKRRPLLHVINFLLPILFFLCLDLASFFIADHRGEKLGFKVTVLLAISVLLLILNDILPAMSNKTPLIATYCIVIFALMLLSLLETILILYLMDKGCSSQEKLPLMDDCKDKEKVSNDPEEKKQSCWFCICRVSNGDKQPELLPVAEEVNSTNQSGDSRVLLLILEQLQELQNTLNRHLRDKGGRSVPWAAKINKLFFLFYVMAVSVFLLFIFYEWSN